MNDSDEAGFTLVEAMIAGTLACLLALPAMSMLRGTYRVVDAMQSRFQLNDQARQVTALLGDGSAILSTAGAGTGSRGSAMVEGLRSRSITVGLSPTDTAPTGSQLTAVSQFVLPDGSLTLSGDSFPALSITCTGPSLPLPSCLASETVTVQGWIGVPPTLSTSGQVSAVGLTLTDPFRARRSTDPKSATETYRTMFNLNVETNP